MSRVCLWKIDSKVGWGEVEKRVGLLKGILDHVSMTLIGDELGIYLLGQKLGFWELILSPRMKRPSKEVLKDIKDGVAIAIEDQESRKEIFLLIDKQSLEVDTGLRSVTDLVYIACKRGLRDRALKT